MNVTLIRMKHQTGDAMKIKTKCTQLVAVLMMMSSLLIANVEDNDQNTTESREVPKELRIAAKEKQEIEIAKSEKANAKKDNMHMAAAYAGAVSATSHPGAFHYASVSIFGDFIVLEDGSGWLVNPVDAYVARTWFPTDLIVITPNRGSYEFCLTNQNTRESVEVSFYIKGTIQVQPGYTRWIDYIDYYKDVIYLNDGTVWGMSMWDSYVIKKWAVGDIVIIGINDGWFKSSNPNILLNAVTNEWARGAVTK